MLYILLLSVYLLEPGIYDLRIPGYEHVEKARKYFDKSLFASTWYLINEPLYKDDSRTEENEKGKKARYFHMGNGSAGCLTVRDHHRWTEIVEFIYRCRKDSKNVGVVEVLSIKK